MKILEKTLALAWKTTVFSALLVSFCMLVLQVVSRFVFNFPIIWTNEIATLAFMWLIFIGAIGAVYDNEMIRMNMILGLFGNTAKKILELFFQIIFLVVSAISIPYSLSLVDKMHILKFDITEIPYSVFYLAGLLFFVFCIPCCLRAIIRMAGNGQTGSGDPET